ncbi:DUF4835 family protein [Hymenobacter sp.]|uniref:type IX secretion system protein PorD n=1 Tax=Hymenobacter sp. TaxID=1898978 RepID=UPI002ED8FBC4
MKRNSLLSSVLVVLTLLLTAPVSQAQEILAEVRVTTENVTIADRSIVQQMQSDIQGFLNTKPFTGQTYRPEERIRMRMFVGITSAQNGQYTATTRIVTTRPVYGTGYETNLLTFSDRNFKFNYSPQNPIDYSENTFVSNLSSLLTFYAYIAIGLDQDSFAKLAGSPYYDRARNVLQNAASQTVTNEADEAWKDGQTRNRYWLLNNLQDPQLEALRTGSYAYYRQGLDIFIEKPDDARSSIFTALQGVQAAATRRPGTLLARAFFDTKADEIANIFRSGSDVQQKQNLANLLTEVDPTNSAKYQAMLKQP